MSLPRLLRLAPLALLAVFAVGCTESPSAPAEELAFDAEESFYLAEAGAASTSMSPEERATRGVTHARERLERVAAQIGAASEEARGLLRAAEVACELAEFHLANGRLRPAVNAAARCAQLASEAGLQGRSERAEALAEQAEAALDEARALVAEAAPLVTATSRPPAPQMLRQAERHLVMAEDALAAGRYPQALAQARQAGARALRIIGALGG